MIKITPFDERSNREDILSTYLNLVASVVPFYPEDVFPEGKFLWEGTWHEADRFWEIAGKRCRNRTEGYTRTLKRYGIREEKSVSRQERIDNDALLAKKIVRKHSAALYNFLYQDVDKKKPRVNAKNLYRLLTVPMNRLRQEEYDLDFVIQDPGSELLAHVFRYDTFAAKTEVSTLLDLMGVEVCPYCNRAFITTLEVEKGSLRSQIDHYKNKSGYPHLALSILNFVPSCAQCNHLKRDKNLPVLYPYAEEMGGSWVFATQPRGSVMYLTGAPSEKDRFEVVGKRVYQREEEGFEERLCNSLEIFRLKELYDRGHRDHVLDLFRQRYVFGEDYLQSLCDRFPDLFHDLTDVKNTMYFTDIRRENWGKRPLSKLVHDIDEEIEGLEGGYE